VTTEHFTLQGARSSTISESTGRASVFLGAVSGGLIAFGLVATAAKTGAAFYMFGLILLPTLAFVGLATFHRVLQSGIEDLGYARRIAQLRDYYLDHAPELAGYLPSPAEPLPTPGLGIGRWQQFLTVAGMVAVITAVLAGSAGGLLAAVISGHSLVAALAAGVVVAAAALTGLMRYENSAWIRGTTASLFPAQKQGHTEPARAARDVPGSGTTGWPIEAGGETWRRLKVTFPDHIRCSSKSTCNHPHPPLRLRGRRLAPDRCDALAAQRPGDHDSAPGWQTKFAALVRTTPASRPPLQPRADYPFSL
jgi:hypothetical protein